MATAIPSYTTASRHCQQLADSLADSPAPSPGPSSTVREWSLGHFPPPGKPERWGCPIGINGLRTRRPSCGRHAEGFAQAVAGGQLILRAIRRHARSCCATAPPSRGAGRRPPALRSLLLPSPAVDPRGELSE